MGRVERAVVAPSASPSQVAGLVASLRSDTVDAPRNLSASLLTRLHEIADHHDGQVPLHGRLFAQWMHHAYPLECPYPHVAGTTSPLTPDEWLDESGAEEVAAPPEELMRWIGRNASRPAVEGLPWTPVEELVVARSFSEVPAKGGSDIVRKLAAFAAVMAFAVPIVRAPTTYASKPSHVKWEKHLV